VTIADVLLLKAARLDAITDIKCFRDLVTPAT